MWLLFEFQCNVEQIPQHCHPFSNNSLSLLLKGEVICDIPNGMIVQGSNCYFIKMFIKNYQRNDNMQELYLSLQLTIISVKKMDRNDWKMPCWCPVDGYSTQTLSIFWMQVLFFVISIRAEPSCREMYAEQMSFPIVNCSHCEQLTISRK